MSLNTINTRERRQGENFDVKDYLGGRKKFFHKGYNKMVVKVFAGEWYITQREDELLATVLGSCIAACIRDPVAKVGGMNHFLLPGEDSQPGNVSDAARYGLHAMESLINALLNAGARKDRLEFKLFGGGNVIQSSVKIGTKNAAFVRRFLADEGYPLTSEDLEGDYPRSIHYYPLTGKAMMRQLRRKEDYIVAKDESAFSKKLVIKAVEGDIELFE